MATKTCPISRQQFTANAKPIQFVINGQTMLADPKQFSTKSMGYFSGGKMVMVIDGTPVTFQVGLNLTAIGSKELPE